jgi:hypothetical protein
MTDYQICIIECLKDGLSFAEMERKTGYSKSWIEKEKVKIKKILNAKTDAQVIYNYYFNL